MSSKTKKKSSKLAPLVVMVVLVIAMFAAYKMMDAKNTPAVDSADTGDSVILLIDRTSSEVTALSYAIGDGETYAFSLRTNTGAWSYVNEPQFPLDQTTVATMAAAICRIGAYRHLEEGDTGEYGFDAPSLTVTVEYTDGTVCRYAIGDENPITGYRYFKNLDTDAVYTIAAALYDYFDYTIDDLFVYDTLPSDIEAAHITSITWTEGDTVTEVTDADAISAMYTAYTALAPSAYADPYADEAESAAYGIGSVTLTVSYKRAVEVTDANGAVSTTRIPATFAVHFGNTAEDGRVYYKLSTSDVIYLAEAETVEAILAATVPAPTEE